MLEQLELLELLELEVKSPSEARRAPPRPAISLLPPPHPPFPRSLEPPRTFAREQ